jgi:hypothetical protein
MPIDSEHPRKYPCECSPNECRVRLAILDPTIKCVTHRRVCRSAADQTIVRHRLAQHVKNTDLKSAGCIHTTTSGKIEQHMIATAIHRRSHHLGVYPKPNPVFIGLELIGVQVAQHPATGSEPLANFVREIVGVTTQ